MSLKGHHERIRVQLLLLGVDFDVVTADGAIEYLSHEKVLSVTQPISDC